MLTAIHMTSTFVTSSPIKDTHLTMIMQKGKTAFKNCALYALGAPT